ncbi:MAG: hypothetical protein H7Y41_05690 [Hyphomonadaceae bacterium]|nr:hypothetical protein [Clostridia bacterium]
MNFDMDVFLEYMVSRKKDGKDYLMNGLLVVAAIVVAAILSVVAEQVGMGQLNLLILAGVCYGAIQLIASRNVEFEYIVTNGEIDVDKIISRKRRKRLLSANMRHAIIVARMDDAQYKNEFNQTTQKTITAVSSMTAPNIYFAIVPTKEQTVKLIFEPSERMLEAFRMINPRNVHI